MYKLLSHVALCFYYNDLDLPKCGALKLKLIFSLKLDYRTILFQIHYTHSLYFFNQPLDSFEK